MSKHLIKTLPCIIISSILVSCGGGGSSSSGTSSTSTTTETSTTPTQTTNADGEIISSQSTGIAVPAEISAVPASSSQSSASLKVALSQFRSAFTANAVTASALPADSDYFTEESSTYVEEPALEQFEIIERVFQAVAQTRYADEGNVNQGPYRAFVSFDEEQNGRDIKQLQEWIVDSRMIVIDPLPTDVTQNTTGDVNRLLAWIPETDRSTGEVEMIKAEFLIYSAPSRDAEGAVINYGEWDMNVLFDADATAVDTIPNTGAEDAFAASARISSTGTSTLSISEKFLESFSEGDVEIEFDTELSGILVRDGTSGYGKVSYPDFDACGGPSGGGNGGPSGPSSNPCANGVPVQTSQYSYTEDFLAVQEIVNDVTQDPVYKTRDESGAIRVVHRYGLYHADADEAQGIAEGDNVEQHRSFGFPISFQASASNDENITFEEFGFYGAWQGRHQIWTQSTVTATTNGSDGTTFTREDVAPGTSPEYKLVEFNGTFTRRDLVDASLDDIENIPVEVFLHENIDLFYLGASDPGASNGAGFYYCDGEIDWENNRACETLNGNNLAFTPLAGSDGNLGTSDDDEILEDIAFSASESNNDRRFVSIFACGPTDSSPGASFECNDYVYINQDPNVSGFTFSTPGFYTASFGNRGLEVGSQSTQLSPSTETHLTISIGGSIYVAYVGFEDTSVTSTGWVEKTLTSFNFETWTPVFDDNGDSQFTPDRGIEYYMHANGQNYVVSRVSDSTTSASAYQARKELQSAATPNNTNSSSSLSLLHESVDFLAQPWNPGLTFTLNEDPSNANYLLLIVRSDSTGNYEAGAIYQDDIWGLFAYNNSNVNQPLSSTGQALIVDEFGWVDPSANGGLEPVQFNYEYAGNDGDTWGRQQFLVTASDITNFITLSDPINLVQVDLYDNRRSTIEETVNLQFDGFMHGIPEVYRYMERNNFSTFGLAEIIRLMLPGQEVVDDNGTRYFAKPLETSLFLGVVSAQSITDGGNDLPNLSLADTVDLDTVPEYTHHEMGAVPSGTDVVVKFVDGVAVTTTP